MTTCETVSGSAGLRVESGVGSRSMIAAKVCALGSVPLPGRRMSPRTAGLLAAVVTPYYKLRGYRPPLVRDQVRSLARHWNFDDSKARRELDWHPRTLDEGLPPTVEFIQAGP